MKPDEDDPYGLEDDESGIAEPAEDEDEDEDGEREEDE